MRKLRLESSQEMIKNDIYRSTPDALYMSQVFIAYARSGCCNETAHMRSLVKASTTRIQDEGMQVKARVVHAI